MSDSKFIHLHTHSEYSLLESPLRLSQMLDYCKDNEVPAIALTDNGVLFAAVDFYLKAKSEGIKPIIGTELFVANDRLQKDRDWSRLIVLCKNKDGYEQLSRIVSQSYEDGFYYRPRVDMELLAWAKDLIVIDPGYWGAVAQAYRSNNAELARQKAQTYKDLFGENFYLGVQLTGNSLEEVLCQEIQILAQDLSIPIVATQDAYYAKQDDAVLKSLLRCIQQGKQLEEDDDMDQAEYYLKSPEEMAERFAHMPEAIANTQVIADACNLELDTDRVQLPTFKCPDGLDDQAYLEQKVWEGINELYDEVTDEIKNRVAHELKTIENMGFPAYFLIVWDIIRFCRENDIPVGPGRGSAAGSIVSYALYITHIDPLEYNLLFERFLNPDRISMPDIDIDFCVERRQEVIQYIVDAYGADHVAQISTFGTMQSRAVLRDTGRALGIPLPEVDRVAKLVPSAPGHSSSIAETLETVPEFSQYYNSNKQAKTWIDYSQRIEGQARHVSTHAAGVVIADEPLAQVVPLIKSDGQLATQYTMGTLETLGLLKMDILGLRNLTVIDYAVEEIRKTEPEFSVDNLGVEDKATYEFLTTGKTRGIFQLESDGMRQLVKDLKPDTFEDIVALLALYRPGPLGSGMVQSFISNKAGETTAEYDLPELEPILKDTYGIILYQEQVMQIASAIGKFTLAQADMLRRAMGKKKKEEMDRLKLVFLDGAKEQEFNVKTAEGIFDKCCKFAEYGFNKSHSAAYALISYQTAYLKCHYPKVYMAALLSSVSDHSDKVAAYIKDLQEMEMPIFPPDINASDLQFRADGDGIRFGLGAVKNLGKQLIEESVKEREANGNFESLLDFCTRLATKGLNKRGLESLIKVGALNSVDDHVGRLLANYELAMDHAQQMAKEKESGQVSLFSDFVETQIETQFKDDVDPINEWDRLGFEETLLGFYLTGHPMDSYQKQVSKAPWRVSTLDQVPGDTTVEVWGLLAGVRRLLTKHKKEMVISRLEDVDGSVDVLLFSRMEDFEHLANGFQEHTIVKVSGKVQQSDSGPAIICQGIQTIDHHFTIQHIHINMASADPISQYEELRRILKSSEGHQPVHIHIDNTHDMVVHKKYWASEQALDKIKEVCGNERVWIG